MFTCLPVDLAAWSLQIFNCIFMCQSVDLAAWSNSSTQLYVQLYLYMAVWSPTNVYVNVPATKPICLVTPKRFAVMFLCQPEDLS